MKLHQQVAFALATLVCVAMLLSVGCSDPTPVDPGSAVQKDVTLKKPDVSNPYHQGINFVSLPIGATWPWKGDLVVYAHGYYSRCEPPWVPDNDKVGDMKISDVVNQLGFAYASTAYSDVGLAVANAVDDMKNLVEWFIGLDPNNDVQRVYIVGPSEGGLVTTLAMERYPETFSGGLAMCGPIGDFRRQLDYFGDFHVVFNYFFPTPNTLVPASLGSPLGVDPDVSWSWSGTYRDNVGLLIANNPHSAEQLLRVTKAPIDPSDPSTVSATILDILWYNVMATQDIVERMGGTPFNNRSPYRWYTGSDNDFLLNRKVQRISANPAALAYVNANLQTSGRVRKPLVTMHTTGDPIIPYWHATLYRLKTLTHGGILAHTHIPIVRYGHCNFTMSEVLAGFAVLVLKVRARELVVPASLFPASEGRAKLFELARSGGARPTIVP